MNRLEAHDGIIQSHDVSNIKDSLPASTHLARKYKRHNRKQFKTKHGEDSSTPPATLTECRTITSGKHRDDTNKANGVPRNESIPRVIESFLNKRMSSSIIDSDHLSRPENSTLGRIGESPT